MIPIQRFYYEGGQPAAAPGQPDAGPGAAAFMDIPPEGDPGFRMIVLIRVNSDEPVPDEFVQEMLEPFHIGPIR